MNVFAKVWNKLIDGWRRMDHLKYARMKGVKIGENCVLVDNPAWNTEPFLISIGDHVLISGQVSFITHDGSTFVFREREPYQGTYKFGPISIGNNCFIGYRSAILPNVRIGNDCIIAACSVVNRDVPDGEVWGGVPARFIMKTEDYAKKCYENRLPYDVEKLATDKDAEMKRIFHIMDNGGVTVSIMICIYFKNGRPLCGNLQTKNVMNCCG